jgi:hypothetical protein
MLNKNGANGANGESAVGNNSADSSWRKQTKHWCFTLNNYTENEMEQMEQMVPQFCEKWVIGKEVGEKCGTPHLQGYIVTGVKLRKKQVIGTFNNKRIDIRPAANLKTVAKYHGKEGDIFMLHGFTREEISGYVKPIKYEGQDLPKLEEFYPWQKKCLELIKEQHDRKVIWIFEGVGNCGKTSFTKFMGFHHGTLMVQKGKYADIMNMAFNLGTKLKSMIIDVPRNNGNKVSYDAIECIKSGIIINTKYETGQCLICPVSIVVFSNFPPDTSKLSEDRWDIYEITEDKDLVKYNEEDLLEQNA